MAALLSSLRTVPPTRRDLTPVDPAGDRDPHGLSIAQRRAFGALVPLLDDPEARDILVQCRSDGVDVWVDRETTVVRVAEPKLTVREAKHIAIALIGAGGRHLDELHPCADVRLGHGLRVHAVLEPVVRHGAAISIRIPRTRPLSLDRLIASGLCSPGSGERLRRAIEQRANILISGATGSGKTTLVGALLEEVPPDERIITIEDVAEIRPRHPHVVSLESRQPNTEGHGEITLDTLLKQSLRMRPDRIVLGECRGPEVVTLLSALNTGHEGGIGTIHANSLQDVPARLEALGALAGLAPRQLARQAVAAIDLVIHVERQAGQHVIRDIAGLAVDASGLLTVARRQRAA